MREEGTIGFKHVIQYESEALTDAEKKWDTCELEAYAIVWAVETLLPFLQDKRFLFYTDHQSLRFLMESQSLTGKLER